MNKSIHWLSSIPGWARERRLSVRRMARFAPGMMVGITIRHGQRSLMGSSYGFVSSSFAWKLTRVVYLIIKIPGYLNLRILLYRAFLNLVVQKREKQMEVKDESILAASKCIEMAMSLVQLTTSSINPGSSGTLQAALFHAMGYLWNGTLTLLLYVRSDSAQGILAASTPDRSKIIDMIESAAAFFATHREALPFARVAAEKLRRLLRKVTVGYVAGDTPSTTTDIHAAYTVPNLDSPDQILNFVPAFDVPGFDVPRFNFDMTFSETPPQGDVLGLTTQLNRNSPHWTPEGEGFYYYATPDAG
jgi:hypothetical protein